MPKGQYDRKTKPQLETAASPMRLRDPFGFVNEYGATYFKPAGAIITNPVEIEVLLAREAPLEAV